jgi:hypothetical protein
LVLNVYYSLPAAIAAQGLNVAVGDIEQRETAMMPESAAPSVAGNRAGNREPGLAAMLLLLGIVVMLSLMAGEHRHPETGLSLWLPDDWNVDIDAASLVASPSGGDPRFEVVALARAAGLAAATDHAKRHVTSRITRFEGATPQRAIDLHGMRGVAWEGGGVQGGMRKQVRMMVFKSPRSWVLAMWTAGEGRAGRQEETWNRISGGLRPAGAGG